MLLFLSFPYLAICLDAAKNKANAMSDICLIYIMYLAFKFKPLQPNVF